MSSSQGQMAAQIASQLPIYLVYLACAVLALVFWRRARLASGLALAAAVWLLAVSIAAMALRTWLIARVEASDMAPDELSRAFMVIAVVGSVAEALGLGTLVAAVFVGRKAPPPAT